MWGERGRRCQVNIINDRRNWLIHTVFYKCTDHEERRECEQQADIKNKIKISLFIYTFLGGHAVRGGGVCSRGAQGGGGGKSVSV